MPVEATVLPDGNYYLPASLRTCAIHSSLVVGLDLFALRASACELPATVETTELKLIKKLRLVTFII